MITCHSRFKVKSYKYESVIFFLRLVNKYISKSIYFLLCFTDYSSCDIDYFYILHSNEAFMAKCCISLLRSGTHFSCDHIITHIYFLVLKHTTQHNISIWEEAINNTIQSSLLQLLCNMISYTCY